jgi:hypothetical protein
MFLHYTAHFIHYTYVMWNKQPCSVEILKKNPKKNSIVLVLLFKTHKGLKIKQKILKFSKYLKSSKKYFVHFLVGCLCGGGCLQGFHLPLQANPRVKYHLKGQCHEINCFRFFHESSSAKPLNITSGSFQIFSKICGDIHKSRCTTNIIDTLPPVSTTPGANFVTGNAGVVWYQ